MRAAVATLCLAAGAAAQKKILVAGDSWGNVVGGYGKTGAMPATLNNHSCDFTYENIAIPGTTSSMWAFDNVTLSALKAGVAGKDYVWLTLMGNDAQSALPQCALGGHSAQECGDKLVATVTPLMEKILEAIHDANPTVRVVGFGYDTFFGATNCGIYAKGLFPQCYLANGTQTEHIHCVNEQVTRLQTDAWDVFAKKYDFVDSVNLLGATQVCGGDPNAKIGEPDLDKFGPPEYWKGGGCIHPSHLGSLCIMEDLYQKYFSKELGC